MELSEETIQKLLKQYEHRKEYQRDYYREKYKNDDKHRELKKLRSKNYYNDKKKVVKENFEVQGDYNRAKKRFNYAVKTNTTDKYKLKYPDDFQKWFKDSIPNTDTNNS